MVHNPSYMKAKQGAGQARGQRAISTRFLLSEGKTPSLVGLGASGDSNVVHWVGTVRYIRWLRRVVLRLGATERMHAQTYHRTPGGCR